MPRARFIIRQLSAQLLWFESGEVEYRFSLGEIDPVQVEWLEISMELSSNAPMYRENFKSDIYVGLGETELGVWTSPGDYGARRGRFNPSWWSDTSSQYGLLKTWRVDNQGCTLDGEPLSSVTLADLNLGGQDYLALRIGVHADAAHVGRHQPVRRTIRRFCAGHRRACGLCQALSLPKPSRHQKPPGLSGFVSKRKTNREVF